MATPAIVVSEYGGPERLELSEIEVPEAGPGQLKVEIAAAGVNFIDIYRRQGVYPVPLPHVPGTEGSGRVIGIGDGVEGVELGDLVAWSGVPRSYAGATVGDADEFVPVPEGVDERQAAAFPLQGMTAHYLAHDSHPIAAGETVLIHAGAGGVGLLLTQMAKIRGARVITTVSTDAKAELSKAAGADEILVGYDGFADKVRELTGGEGVAAVYDGVGKDTFDGSLASLRIRGMLVLFGGSSGQVPPFDPQRLNAGGSLSLTRPTLAHFTRTREELLRRAADVLGWIADGRLDVRIGGSYPLAYAAQAHEDLAARRTTGKLLLVP